MSNMQDTSWATAMSQNEEHQIVISMGQSFDTHSVVTSKKNNFGLFEINSFQNQLCKDLHQ